MRPSSAGRLAAFALLILVPILRADPPAKTPDGYEKVNLEGFTVYANLRVTGQAHDGFHRPPLRVLENELNDLKRILHPKIVGILQGIPIWAEWDVSDSISPGAVARYYGGPADHYRKMGGDPRKANCVEVMSIKTLASIRRPGTPLQQIIILHEMAHAVHHRLLGWENPELEAVFKQAVDRKLYDWVNDRFGRQGKAYARTNAGEYFAEISCAYLDSCNYFPFNYEQLRGHDPAGFKFAERVWKQPDRFSLIAVKTGTETPSTKTNTKKGVPAASEPVTPRTDSQAEMDAMVTLDRLRGQANNKAKQAEVKKGLEILIRTFPGTDAASEAKDLLKSIK